MAVDYEFLLRRAFGLAQQDDIVKAIPHKTSRLGSEKVV